MRVPVVLSMALAMAGAATVTSTGGPVSAQPAPPALEPGAPPLATQRYRLARELYAQGKLREALAEMEVAYKLFPTSAKLAYNLARTQERLEMWAEARRHYLRYLELAPQAEDRPQIEAVIGVLDQRLAPAPAPVSSAPPPSAPPTAAPTKAAASAKPPAPASQVSDRAVTGEPGPPAWALPVGWGAVGLGAVGAVLAVVGYMGAADAAEKIDGLPKGEKDRHDALQSDVDSGNTLGVAGLATAVVFGGAGALLLVWPFGEGRASAAAVPSPGGVAFGLTLTWP